MGSPLWTPPAGGLDTAGARAALVDDYWLAAPDLFAEHFSGGAWRSAMHLRLIAAALAECMAGRIKRLIVMMPPRHGKTELISRWAPLWMLALRPEMRIVLASYGANLARRNSLWARRTLRQIGPQIGVALQPGQQLAHDWATTAGGGMFATGVNGELVGRGANAMLIDDPVRSAKEARSPVIRDAAWQWWLSDARSRLQPDGFAVLLMTRFHEADLAGKMLEAMQDGTGEQWHVLRLPALAEEDEDWGFWQRKRGEALWPQLGWDRAWAENLRKTTPRSTWAGLYQQRPVADGGAIWLRKWFAGGRQRFDINDVALRSTVAGRYISVDSAIKDEDDSAYTVFGAGDLTEDYHLAIRDVLRMKVQTPYLPEKLIEYATRWNYDGKLQEIIIEDKASGTTLLQTLQLNAPEWMKPKIRGYLPIYDKPERGQLAAVYGRMGCVLFPHPSEGAPWLHDFESEIYSAPASTFLDQFDMLNQMVLWLEHYLNEGWVGRGSILPPENEDWEYEEAA